MSNQMHTSKKKKADPSFVELPAYRDLIHELRNSLSIIFMQAQLLVQQTEAGDSEADEIKKSAKAVEQSIIEMVALLASK